MAGEILRGKRRLCFGNWRCDAQKVVQINHLLRVIYLGWDMRRKEKTPQSTPSRRQVLDKECDVRKVS